MDVTAPRIDSMEPDKGDLKISKLYPLHFHYVKTLFLQQQYRQCILTCRQILEADHDDSPTHPLEDIFMRLYIALAHDDLARSMHNFSPAKVSAFSQAASLYQEAAAAVPEAENCRRLLRQQDSSPEEDSTPPTTSLPDSTSQSTLDSEVFRRPPSPSPFLSPPREQQPILPRSKSPGWTRSGPDDDLESHDSFDEIMAPPRMQRLPSTFSSMSLLDPHKSAHSLLRPVRPSSIANPYQPSRTSSPSRKQFCSRLPRLNTGSSLGSPPQSPQRQSSPVRKQLRAADEQDWSLMGVPSACVSPLGSEYIHSDDMSISPLEPSTPVDAKADMDSPNPPALPSVEHAAAHPFREHLQGLRAQIETQVRLLQDAKQRTTAAQIEREARDNIRQVSASKATKLGGGMPQSRSFWLFTSEDVKVMEKQRRIENGRQRLWARPRFDPSRYQELAEKALLEL